MISKEIIKCSFCKRSEAEVDRMIGGPGVQICDDCIDLCNEIIEEERIVNDYDGADDTQVYSDVNEIVNEVSRANGIADPDHEFGEFLRDHFLAVDDQERASAVISDSSGGRLVVDTGFDLCPEDIDEITVTETRSITYKLRK